MYYNLIHRLPKLLSWIVLFGSSASSSPEQQWHVGRDSWAWPGGTSCRPRSQQAFLPGLCASRHFHPAARVWKWAIDKRASFTHGHKVCIFFYFRTYVNHVNKYTVILKQQHSLWISKSYGCFSESEEAKYHFNFLGNLCFWLSSSLENLLANIFTKIHILFYLLSK